jgi:rhodanese-related sulfurtransferase
VTPQQLSDLVNKQEGTVLDVRDHNEFRKGHIIGAVNIPFNDLEKRITELADKKNKPVIVVCKIGQTASSAGKQLTAQGFESVYKLAGGISEWTAANLPLVK